MGGDNLIIVLICISLIITDVEHLFMCHLCVFFGEMSRSSVLFFEWVLCFDDVKRHELFVKFGD